MKTKYIVETARWCGSLERYKDMKDIVFLRALFPRSEINKLEVRLREMAKNDTRVYQENSREEGR